MCKEHRQPDGRGVGRGGRDAVFLVSGNEEVVAGGEGEGVGLEFKGGVAVEEKEPFVFGLVVPEARRTGVAGGDDMLNADVSRCGERFGEFGGKRFGEVGEEIGGARRDGERVALEERLAVHF